MVVVVIMITVFLCSFCYIYTVLFQQGPGRGEHETGDAPDVQHEPAHDDARLRPPGFQSVNALGQVGAHPTPLPLFATHGPPPSPPAPLRAPRLTVGQSGNGLDLLVADDMLTSCGITAMLPVLESNPGEGVLHPRSGKDVLRTSPGKDVSPIVVGGYFAP